MERTLKSTDPDIGSILLEALIIKDTNKINTEKLFVDENNIDENKKKSNVISIYTDASKKKRKSGSYRIGWGFVGFNSDNKVVGFGNGIFVNNYSIDGFKPKLGYRYNDHNVNSAEIGAILNAFKYAEEFSKKNKSKFKIYSDSKEALNHLKNKTPKNIKMYHVRGHTGITGNEMADKLAKGNINTIYHLKCQIKQTKNRNYRFQR